PPLSERASTKALGFASVYRERSRAVKTNPSLPARHVAPVRVLLSGSRSVSLGTPERHLHRAGGLAVVVIQREGDDAVAGARAGTGGRFGPLAGALLAEALLVVELHPPDAPELLGTAVRRGALDVEAPEIVHALAAGVGDRTPPGELHAGLGRARHERRRG